MVKIEEKKEVEYNEHYKDLRDKIDFLQKYHTESAERLDEFYTRTIAMVDYIATGGDVDKILFKWQGLINELADIKIGGAGYYNAHITNLVNMVDEALKTDK